MKEIEEKFRRCARFGGNPMPDERMAEVLHFLREIDNQNDVARILPIFPKTRTDFFPNSTNLFSPSIPSDFFPQQLGILGEKLHYPLDKTVEAVFLQNGATFQIH